MSADAMRAVQRHSRQTGSYYNYLHTFSALCQTGGVLIRSKAKLAAALRISTATLERFIEDCVEVGELEVHERFNTSGFQLASLYRLVLPDLEVIELEDFSQPKSKATPKAKGGAICTPLQDEQGGAILSGQGGANLTPPIHQHVKDNLTSNSKGGATTEPAKGIEDAKAKDENRETLRTAQEALTKTNTGLLLAKLLGSKWVGKYMEHIPSWVMKWGVEEINAAWKQAKRDVVLVAGQPSSTTGLFAAILNGAPGLDRSLIDQPAATQEQKVWRVGDVALYGGEQKVVSAISDDATFLDFLDGTYGLASACKES